MSKELLNNSILKIISLIIFIFLLVHFFDAEIFSFKNKSSLSGYSMIEVVNSYNGNLLNLEKGFINTGHHKTTSLISWIYIGLNFLFNIEPLNITYFFLLFEFIFITFSASYFLKALGNKNYLPLSIFYTSLILFTNVEQNNWANYGQIFNGEWYNIPNSLFLLVLANILKNRLSNSIYLLLLTFLIHPSKGFMLILSVGPLVLYKILSEAESLKKARNSIILSITISFIYIYFFILDQNVNLMDPELWIMITDSHSYHFLKGPLDSEFIIYSFIPITLLTICLSRYLVGTGLESIVWSMYIISLIGKYIDIYSTSPTLISIALHRLTENILLLSLLFIFIPSKNRFFHKLFELTAYYILFFGLPEANKYNTFVIVLILILIIKNRNNSIYFSIITLLLILNSNDLFIYDNKYIFKDSPVFTDQRALILLILFFVLFYFSDFLENGLSSAYLFLIAISIFLFAFFTNNYQLTNSEEIFSEKTNSYYDAQIWANLNTPKSAIFMPDPYISYAWRDFSNRNSFGTPREFVTSWLYTRDKYIFDDAIDRLGVFTDNPIELMTKFRYDDYINFVGTKYYEGNLSLFKNLCENYGVDFYLWNANYSIPNFLEPVYENSSYLILKLKKGC